MKKKIITCIGDSLTEGDYGISGKTGIPNIQKENYPYFLKKYTKTIVNNFGHCGFKSSDVLNSLKKGIDNIEQSNIIIIFLGTNGGQSEEGNSDEDIAYRKIIEFCKLKASLASIYLVTPPNATINPSYSNFGYFPQVEQAQHFVRKIGAEYNLPVIDLANHPLLSSENEHVMQPNDGLYFSKIGYKTIALAVFKAIEKDL